MMVVVLCAMAAGLGAWLLLREFVPSHPNLHEAIDRLAPGNLVRGWAPTPDGSAPGAATGMDAIGVWAHRHLSTIPGLKVPGDDLRLLQENPAGLYTCKVIGALVGLALPLLLSAASLILGLGLPVSLLVPFGLVFALIGWLIPDQSVHRRANLARDEFSRAAVAFAQMIAIGRIAGLTAQLSINTAARISDSWMFLRIREELQLAEWARIPAWQSLTALGERYGLSEIVQIAEVMRLSGEQGAGVYEQLLAQAESLDDKIQSDEGARADETTQGLDAPIALLAVIFLVALLYPLLLTLSSA